MTVLGLGNMGRALAQALLNEGHKVTVWNRTAARAEALVRNGATLAKSPTEAIAASQLTIMCVLDNESARAILESSVTGQSFAGKTLVQFTTGTADELNAQRDWISSNGGHFIAGGILVFPSGIGKPNTLIVYAGEPEAFETSRALLSGLGGSPHYLGSDSCAVVGAFFTLATFGAGALSMFYETAALARQFGLDIETYHALAEKIVDALLRDGMHEATEKVTSGLFTDDLANIDLGLVTIEEALMVFKETGIPTIMTQALIEQLRLASKAGDGNKDLAYVVESLSSQKV